MRNSLPFVVFCGPSYLLGALHVFSNLILTTDLRGRVPPISILQVRGLRFSRLSCFPSNTAVTVHGNYFILFSNEVSRVRDLFELYSQWLHICAPWGKQTGHMKTGRSIFFVSGDNKPITRLSLKYYAVYSVFVCLSCYLLSSLPGFCFLITLA